MIPPNTPRKAIPRRRSGRLPPHMKVARSPTTPLSAIGTPGLAFYRLRVTGFDFPFRDRASCAACGHPGRSITGLVAKQAASLAGAEARRRREMRSTERTTRNWRADEAAHSTCARVRRDGIPPHLAEGGRSLASAVLGQPGPEFHPRAHESGLCRRDAEAQLKRYRGHGIAT